jgi:hypothetical protein
MNSPRAGVGFVDGLVQVPVVELQAADAERVSRL